MTSFCLELHSSPVLHIAGSLSSYKSSLNVTSSERLSVAICIRRGPGGKQWHTHIRIIQGVFIRAWSKTKGYHRDRAETTLGQKDEGAGQWLQPAQVILHREATRINTPTSSASLISCWRSPLAEPTRSRGQESPLTWSIQVSLPGQRPG